ncbi:MAG TPA: hypothetical protein PL033_21175 [Candidatus Brocadiia bacterium]|nr:hypothetical protein [Candidatus Brocadiia bacterium]
MKTGTKRALWRFLIFGMLGLLLEVTMGAVLKLWAEIFHNNGNWNLRGSTSWWMIFDYGLMGLVLMPLANPMKNRHIPMFLRAIVYMILIFAVEFVSGWIFDLAGLEIWDYSGFKYNLFGYITPQYIPVWYILGLAAEPVYRQVDKAAAALASGIAADDIERMGTEPRSGKTRGGKA